MFSRSVTEAYQGTGTLPAAAVSEIHGSVVHPFAGHDSCCYRVVVPGSRVAALGAKDFPFW